MVADNPNETDGTTAESNRGASPAVPNPDAPAARAPGGAVQRQTVFRPEIVRRSQDHAGGSRREVGGYSEGKRLVVGRDISLSGAISACEKLVVEGRVEASISDCREIEIADGGAFKGEAEIEVADIRGDFEGTLIARNLLMVRATGRVSGKIRYGRLEVERGGSVAGNIAAFDPEESAREKDGTASA